MSKIILKGFLKLECEIELARLNVFSGDFNYNEIIYRLINLLNRHFIIGYKFDNSEMNIDSFAAEFTMAFLFDRSGGKLGFSEVPFEIVYIDECYGELIIKGNEYSNISLDVSKWNTERKVTYHHFTPSLRHTLRGLCLNFKPVRWNSKDDGYINKSDQDGDTDYKSLMIINDNNKYFTIDDEKNGRILSDLVIYYPEDFIVPWKLNYLNDIIRYIYTDGIRVVIITNSNDLIGMMKPYNHYHNLVKKPLEN